MFAATFIIRNLYPYVVHLTAAFLPIPPFRPLPLPHSHSWFLAKIPKTCAVSPSTAMQSHLSVCCCNYYLLAFACCLWCQKSSTIEPQFLSEE